MTTPKARRPGSGWIAAVLGAAALAAGGTPSSTLAQGDPALALELVAEGLTSPVELQELPDGSGRLLVADQAGLIHLLPGSAGEERRIFLDLRDRMVSLREGFDERGLLGLALHPDFRENRRLFLYYSAPLRENGPEKFDHTARLSEFTANQDFSAADPESERILLQVDQPQFNHNGGSLAFGPDGSLYLSLGDGGAAHDVGEGHSNMGNAQDTSNLLGSILRIGVDGEHPYSVPDDNPFVGKDGRDEIYAYGLRNTWGLSFDDDGTLYGADVGQHLFEEVNILKRGENYGWNIREGLHCFDPQNPREPPDDCPSKGPRGEPLVDPILEYKNVNAFPGETKAYGISVIGGHRYRGKALPGLEGRYIFGDWSRRWGGGSGVLLVATPPEGDAAGRWEVKELKTGAPGESGQLEGFLLAIGRDAEGELYLMTASSQAPSGQTGKIHKLVAEKE